MIVKYRNRVLALLTLLSVITYLDRVCISVAGPRMQEALKISPAAWGWVTGIFVISYAIFEIPTGVLGDRIGPRRVLTRIVLWWSGFTTVTGLVTGYYPLLLARFLFGAGEAGAYPNASVVVARWFPVHERGRAFGIVLMAGQVGGAIAPLLVVPIQIQYGWRACFFLFGILGVLWSVIWYRWFRDSPAEKRGVTAAELDEMRGSIVPAHQRLPWRVALRSTNIWAVLGVALCYMYTFYFFQSWFHTYLVKALGFSEKNLLFSSLPYFVAAAANCGGGLLSNVLVKKIGLKWGRCSIGLASLGVSASCTVAAMLTQRQSDAMILLTVVYAGITFQQPIMFAVCLDIGGAYAGAMVGAMNTSAQIGAFASSLTFGYLVDRYASYTLPFIPMALLLMVGAALWFKVDPTKPLMAPPRAQDLSAASVSIV
jgi:MFS transporter, ACS family, glucarate transporter